MLIFAIALLSGCSTSKEEFINEINVDVTLSITGVTNLGDNTYQFGTIRQEELVETFEITQIESLDTGWGEFPYESTFINEKEWDSYLDIIKDLFDSISMNDSIGGGVGPWTGPKAKLLITLQSNNLVLICEFYQDSTEHISGMAIRYTDSNDINEIKMYAEDYSEIYTRLNEIIWN
jgi:hypothetical protein